MCINNRIFVSWLFLLACAAAVGRAGPVGAFEAPEQSPTRGILRSLNESTIAVELAARVTAIPFRESERFVKGDVLIEFECDKHQADLKAALAEYRGHKITVDNSHNLQSLRAAGALDVALAEAQADKAAAAVEAANARVKECKIFAPYDGRIVDLLTHAHDMSAPNAPLMRIIDDRHLEIDLIVPSQMLRWLKEGAAFAFKIDETGVIVPAKVLRIGAAVDPVSQTVKLTGAMTATAIGVLPGMSGTADFERQEQ
jgi:membrane fusion protein (multidrug efflux system)